MKTVVVHLTNVAVQKNAPDYDPEKGCKWSVIKLRQYLIAKHGIEKVGAGAATAAKVQPAVSAAHWLSF